MDEFSFATLVLVVDIEREESCVAGGEVEEGLVDEVQVDVELVDAVAD